MIVAGSHVVRREKVLAGRREDGIDKFQGNAPVFVYHACPMSMCHVCVKVVWMCMHRDTDVNHGWLCVSSLRLETDFRLATTY